MQNLKIGVFGDKPGWMIILKQIGVSFEVIDLGSELHSLEYSIVIVCSNLNRSEIKKIENYQAEGGAVLFESAHYAKYASKSVIHKKTKYLISDTESIFSSVGLVDIYSKIKLLQDHKLKILDKGLHICTKGNTVVIPYNINDLITNTASIRKRFYASRKELPSEIVSKVSKAKLRKIIEICLKYLHHKRDLPFVHLFHKPKPDKNVFIFRLDTDYCTQQEANEIEEICNKNNISATWFLDTESEKKLKNYAKMADQELGIHCDKHYIYNNFSDNYENLQRANDKLKECNISAHGFAAPFGDWNCTLDKALQENHLKYSSEFTLDYDDLPFYPFCHNGFSKVLQIPIHPISLGRLRRSHFDKDEMLQYYLEWIKFRSEQDEPVIIYHHPHHRYSEIIDKIFQYINLHDYENMTMLEYYKWWKERYKLEPEFQIDENKLKVNYNKNTILTKISRKNGYSITESGEMDLNKIPIKPYVKKKHTDDKKRIRKFHWRDVLYNYESKRSKKHYLNN